MDNKKELKSIEVEVPVSGRKINVTCRDINLAINCCKEIDSIYDDALNSSSRTESLDTLKRAGLYLSYSHYRCFREDNVKMVDFFKMSILNDPDFSKYDCDVREDLRYAKQSISIIKNKLESLLVKFDTTLYHIEIHHNGRDYYSREFKKDSEDMKIFKSWVDEDDNKLTIYGEDNSQIIFGSNLINNAVVKLIKDGN